MDNTHAGTNAGTQDNPFQSFADLWPSMSQSDTVYVKGNGPENPYREALTHADLQLSTVYFDWTGTGNERGSMQAYVWGSRNVSDEMSSGWTEHTDGVSGTYYASTTFGSATGCAAWLSYYGSGMATIWYLADDGTVYPLRGAVSWGADTVNEGEYYWQFVGGERLYINLPGGVDPTGKHLEFICRSVNVEPWDGSIFFGGVFKFGGYGIRHTTCNNFTVQDAIAEYNVVAGIRTESLGVGRSYFSRVITRYNGMYGIWVAGAAYNLEFNYCLSHGNAERGVYVAANQTGNQTDIDFFNLTVYDTPGTASVTGVGFYVDDAANAINVTVKNTVVDNSEGDDFYLDDTSGNATVTCDYNAYDTVGGDWPAGGNSIDHGGSPGFVSSTNLNLTSSSILRGAATDSVYAGDVYDLNLNLIVSGGSAVDGALDIGAYEFLESKKNIMPWIPLLLLGD